MPVHQFIALCVSRIKTYYCLTRKLNYKPKLCQNAALSLSGMYLNIHQLNVGRFVKINKMYRREHFSR